MTSLTVTTASAVSLFPLLSVTVKVTVLLPTLAHVNELGETLYEAMPQASVEPSLTCSPVMLNVPLADKFKDKFCVTTLGFVTSDTVTTAVAVSSLPQASSTVKVTVLGPMSVQSKEDGDTESVTPEHASELPLSTSAPEIVALPSASRETAMSLAEATGFVSSTIV